MTKASLKGKMTVFAAVALSVVLIAVSVSYRRNYASCCGRDYC